MVLHEPCHGPHKKEHISPLAGKAYFYGSVGALLRQIEHVAALAAVFPPALFFTYAAVFLKVGNRTLNRAAGQFQFSGDGTNRRIAFAVLIGAVMQVHIDSPRPVWKL